ncbi:cyclic GMP-AMP synthase DncV-like nucleotidyltransferase [Rhizobium johnstonii]|uniref:SMODS domain-containing nucleotidyltransferase n=1 Tax=Rhizobium TaxID=379 RepID=UPI00103229F0|nr:nucleotidyltransferase [Rhizobium leguminosarum]NKL64888.1 nucleotidyltransferase [Rhizobium leguminosarum bv. viciae]TBF83173.1 nucleotidyltransferase [Rhizobium leguminosarum]TBH02622.1 nucleotidyltransferase [Rhizobium leguminosarum]TBH12068.1 nucleotidyltransferase [Rhizobium leguminosarum]TBH37117.1 nucleotidyltransferase [Rhizobium leguminosarum]
MKLQTQFNDFLIETVNLNATRVNLLSDAVVNLKSFIRKSDYGARIKTFARQGSWAHQTIIKPLAGDEYDADLLMVVYAKDGWAASDYVDYLYNVFAASRVYRDKVTRYDYCVTIEYAGVRKVDIAPCVIDRVWQGYEVCNRAKNQFEETRPIEYTEWLIEQNGYSGGNSFRKVTRLLKYLRDIKTTFTCPSVLLTTLIGQQISWLDQGKANYADVPTALLTLISRLDDWLQQRPNRPQVLNPKLSTEDFGLLWTDNQYGNFRNCIHRYRGWIEEAYSCEDRGESIKAWQRVFGDEFGKGANVLAEKAATDALSVDHFLSETAAHSDGLVDFVKRAGLAILPKWFFRPPYLKAPQWPVSRELIRTVRVLATWHSSKDSTDRKPVLAGDPVPPRGGLWFEVRQPDGSIIPDGFIVHWRVTNTGAAAIAANSQRGDFYVSNRRYSRWEPLQYRGVHMTEAFIVRMSDGVLVAQSEPFAVLIE